MEKSREEIIAEIVRYNQARSEQIIGHIGRGIPDQVEALPLMREVAERVMRDIEAAIAAL